MPALPGGTGLDNGGTSGERLPETPLYVRKVTQSEFELAGLIDVLQRENVTRFLEIGSRFGGSLWRIARALPAGSLIVAVDSGHGVGGRGKEAIKSLEECVAQLRGEGYDAHAIIGDSHDPAILKETWHHAPFDAVFIDGDHTLSGVTCDWRDYGQMGRLVAFHDTHWIRPSDMAMPVDVPKLWSQLKKQYRYEEFHDEKVNMGIGVLWKKNT